jgi:prevent-host-death family protein
MKVVPASKFKEQCLAFLDRVDPEGIVITKHGKPVAKLIPVGAEPAMLIGSLKGKIRIKGNICRPVSRGMLNLDTHVLLYALTAQLTRREATLLAREARSSCPADRLIQGLREGVDSNAPAASHRRPTCALMELKSARNDQVALASDATVVEFAK